VSGSKKYRLGLLIIDEVQHLCGARGLGDERMLNFFVTLVNTQEYLLY